MYQRFIGSFRKGRPCLNNIAAEDRRKPRRSGRRARSRPPHSRWIKSLGKLDQLVKHNKPQSRFSWISTEIYVKLPATMQLREFKYAVKQRGYCTSDIIFVTTLQDSA